MEKLHAAVARSTFPSQNVKNMSGWERFFEVEMLKNCTPLWREAHFQVKMLKTCQVRKPFEVEMLKNCTPLWREAHFEVKMLKN